MCGKDFAGTERGRLEQLGYRPRTITAGEIGSADGSPPSSTNSDALYVCGGADNFVLLANLRRHGLDLTYSSVKFVPAEGIRPPSIRFRFIGLSAREL